MTRGQFLAHASKAVGRPIGPHLLLYAVNRGYVRPSVKQAGWLVYDREQLEAFVAYLRERSRILLGATSA